MKKLCAGSGAAALIVTGALAGAAAAAPVHSGGGVRFYVTPGSGTRSTILVAGAIGDHGTAVSVDAHGKVSDQGGYERVRLTRGGFTVDSRRFDRAIDRARPAMNHKTCSLEIAARGTATIGKGTGDYAGIHGTVTLKATFAILGRRAADGSCGQGAPVSGFESITGGGHVGF
jgi:hypothetical protein